MALWKPAIKTMLHQQSTSVGLAVSIIVVKQSQTTVSCIVVTIHRGGGEKYNNQPGGHKAR